MTWGNTDDNRYDERDDEREDDGMCLNDPCEHPLCPEHGEDDPWEGEEVEPHYGPMSATVRRVMR